MKSVALSINRSIVSAAVVAAVVLCGMFLSVPRAHATSLSQDQIQSIAKSLAAQGVDTAKIGKIMLILSDRGNSSQNQDQQDSNQGMPNGVGAAGKNCPSPARGIGRGEQGDDVKMLQARLVQDGELSQDNATGFFGSSTQAALMHWQMDHGIVASGTPETTGFGKVGKKTLEAMMRSCDQDRQMGPRFENGNGSPVPQRPPMPPSAMQGQQSSAGVVMQFLSDYSDAFNANLSAAITAPISNSGTIGQFVNDYSDAFNANLAAVVNAPFQVTTDVLSDMLYNYMYQ